MIAMLFNITTIRSIGYNYSINKTQAKYYQNKKERLIKMLKEKLLEDLKNSMKEKNINRKNVIQMVRAAILQKEKDNNIELDDNQILEIIAKEHKKKSDSLEEYKKADRADLIAQIEEEIDVLNEYLPQQLSDEELKKIIKEIITETGASGMKDMGKVMKLAKEKCGVTADGKAINQIAKEMLT